MTFMIIILFKVTCLLEFLWSIIVYNYWAIGSKACSLWYSLQFTVHVDTLIDTVQHVYLLRNEIKTSEDIY